MGFCRAVQTAAAAQTQIVNIRECYADDISPSAYCTVTFYNFFFLVNVFIF